MNRSGDLAINPISHPGGVVRLGQAAQFQLSLPAASPVAAVRTRVYVEANSVLYVRPLHEWSSSEEALRPFWFFPEAPGRYSLLVCVEWPGGSTRRCRLELRVDPVEGIRLEPQLARAANDLEMWSPSAWESESLRHHELQTLRLLPQHLRPGDAAYDVGANLGLFAVRMGDLVGPKGHLYCIEANPVCLSFLRANLARNRLPGARVLPLALSDREGTVEFSVNFDNSNLGVSRDSGFFASKPGQRIVVDAMDFDGLVERFQLEPPRCVKIDVEGAEASVVRGMQVSLSRSHPVIVAELHGRQATAETTALLAGFGYRYFDVARGAWFADGPALMEGQPDVPIHVIATSGPRRPE
jgi:FkbM family methyltransferase